MDMTAPFVMLVDDEVQFVETMAKRLTARDIETITAFSAEEGLEKLESNQNLDVIVLDVKMPGMDGLDMLKKIKSGFFRIEVIMLTGHATIESGINGMKLGAYDFLTKPCDVDELVGKINEATQKKRAHDEKIKEAEQQNLLKKLEP
jgi:DNA-binding NtrC family response regulator